MLIPKDSRRVEDVVWVEKQHEEIGLAEGRGIRDGAGERADDLQVYCCVVRGTTMGNLQTVNSYHEQWIGLSLPVGHFRVKAARLGKREPMWR